MKAHVDRLKVWARAIKQDVHAVYLCARDPRIPICVKALALGVAAYALSPIDLIPDFVPIVGYLDDLVIVPLGVALVVRLIPSDVMAEHRAIAAVQDRSVSKAGALVVVAIWLTTTLWLAYRLWNGEPEQVG